MKNLLLIAGALLILSGCTEDIKKQERVIRPVKTLHVKSELNTFRFETPGTIRASKRAQLSFNVSGTIVALNAKEGNEVKKGDLIARIDRKDFENNYLVAQANLKQAQLVFDRYQSLFKQNAIAKARLDRAIQDFDTAKASMKIAKKALSDTELRAYFSGTISKRHVENFRNIAAKEPIVSIEDRSMLEIVVHVPQRIMVVFDKESIMSLSASLDAIGDKKFPLTLKEVSIKADSSTRTFAITLSMEPPKEYNILTGMTASVEAVLYKNNKEDRILVPVSSVLGSLDNKTFVWIYSEKSRSVSKREVEIGEISGAKIEIKFGLEVGETIVSAGVNYLAEDMVVRPLDGKIGQ